MTRQKPFASELCVLASNALANVMGGKSPSKSWEDDPKKNWPKGLVDEEKKERNQLLKDYKGFTDDNKKKTKNLPNWGRKR